MFKHSRESTKLQCRNKKSNLKDKKENIDLFIVKNIFSETPTWAKKDISLFIYRNILQGSTSSTESNSHEEEYKTRKFQKRE